MQVDSIAKISTITLSLLLFTVCFAAISAASHTRLHSLSYISMALAVVTGLLALIKIANSVSVKLPRPFAICIHWIHAMVFEVIALFVVPMLRIFTATMPSGSKEGRPILLVHGYCNDGTVWLYMRRYLAKEQLGPIYTIDLGHPFRSIRDYAKKVAAKVEEIRKETGRADVILIGHSMGGLVSAVYALSAEQGTVTDVITIGSPLAGTHIAKIGVGPNAKEMQRSSELINELNERLKQEKHIRFYHIATETDQMVIPMRSALQGNCPDREFVFQDIGHASLLFSPRVGAVLAAWLKS